MLQSRRHLSSVTQLVALSVPLVASRPTSCVLTSSPIVLQTSDLFTQLALWLPLAIEHRSSILTCSFLLRRATNFVLLHLLVSPSLPSFAARTRTPSTHYEKEVVESSIQFFFLYFNLAPDTNSLLHRFARSRRSFTVSLMKLKFHLAQRASPVSLRSTSSVSFRETLRSLETTHS